MVTVDVHVQKASNLRTSSFSQEPGGRRSAIIAFATASERSGAAETTAAVVEGNPSQSGALGSVAWPKPLRLSVADHATNCKVRIRVFATLVSERRSALVTRFLGPYELVGQAIFDSSEHPLGSNIWLGLQGREDHGLHARSAGEVLVKVTAPGLQAASPRVLRGLFSAKQKPTLFDSRLSALPEPFREVYDVYGFKDGNGGRRATRAHAADDGARVLQHQHDTLRWERQSEAWFAALHHREQDAARSAALGEEDASLAFLVALGIPLELRPRIWRQLSGATVLRLEDPGGEHGETVALSRWIDHALVTSGQSESTTYAGTLARVADLDPQVQQQIHLDLPRTFPEHIFLADEASLESLRRVLSAHAVRDPARGYTQALNFIAGFLLLFMSEENAFWSLCAVSEAILPRYFEAGMCGVRADNAVFEELARGDPQLSLAFQVIDATDASISLMTTAWFMALFTTVLPPESALRVLDLFFLHGAPALLATGLALFKMAAPALERSQELEHVYDALRQVPRHATDADALVTMAVDELRAMQSPLRPRLASLRDVTLRGIQVDTFRTDLRRRLPRVAGMDEAVGRLAAMDLSTVLAARQQAPQPAGLETSPATPQAQQAMKHIFTILAQVALSPFWRPGLIADILASGILASEGRSELSPSEVLATSLGAALGHDDGYRIAAIVGDLREEGHTRLPERLRAILHDAVSMVDIAPGSAAERAECRATVVDAFVEVAFPDIHVEPSPHHTVVDAAQFRRFVRAQPHLLELLRPVDTRPSEHGAHAPTVSASSPGPGMKPRPAGAMAGHVAAGAVH